MRGAGTAFGSAGIGGRAHSPSLPRATSLIPRLRAVVSPRHRSFAFHFPHAPALRLMRAGPMKYSTYLIFGAPGSGKGTQGKILGAIPRFFHCACGDVFRSLDTRTAIGQAFLDYSSK